MKPLGQPVSKPSTPTGLGNDSAAVSAQSAPAPREATVIWSARPQASAMERLRTAFSDFRQRVSAAFERLQSLFVSARLPVSHIRAQPAPVLVRTPEVLTQPDGDPENIALEELRGSPAMAAATLRRDDLFLSEQSAVPAAQPLINEKKELPQASLRGHFEFNNEADRKVLAQMRALIQSSEGSKALEKDSGNYIFSDEFFSQAKEIYARYSPDEKAFASWSEEQKINFNVAQFVLGFTVVQEDLADRASDALLDMATGIADGIADTVSQVSATISSWLPGSEPAPPSSFEDREKETQDLIKQIVANLEALSPDNPDQSPMTEPDAPSRAKKSS